MPRKIAVFRKLPAFRAARGELGAGRLAFTYVLSTGIFAVALGLRFWLDPVLPPGFPFLTFFPAVVIAGFLFGVPQGTLVGGLGALASWHFFLAADAAPDTGTVMAMALYVFVVATDLFLISLMMSAYRAEMQARRDLERMARDREMLTGELDHRLKNVFATMNAVITLSQRHATTAGELARKLKERLSSMARSSLLLRGDGHSGPATLDAVIEQALSPFGAGDCNRFSLSGPCIRMAGPAPVVLSLILHELGTNAAKYGALSVATGRVSIDWQELRGTEEAQEPQLQIVWRETGGPAPAAEPVRKGFGSTLIARIVSMLDGEAQVAFPQSGATVTMTIPVSALALPHADAELGTDARERRPAA